MRKLWIFKVLGGTRFAAQVQGSPAMTHDGTASLLRCLCTDKQARELEIFMTGKGCRVTAHCPSESQEQTEKRKNMFAILGGEPVWPTAKCPGCSWFDPMLNAGMCGAGLVPPFEGWSDVAIQERITAAKFASDRLACPFLRG